MAALLIQENSGVPLVPAFLSLPLQASGSLSHTAPWSEFSFAHITQSWILFPATKLVLNIYWKDWCWSWNSNTLATWCEEMTHWKRPWCWERLKVGGERDNRGWDGWMVSLTRWTWVWTLGVGDGQGGLASFSSRGCKESDMTEPRNWKNVKRY